MNSTSSRRRTCPLGQAPHLLRGLAALLLASAAPVALGASLSIGGGAVVLGRTESSPVLIRVDEPPGAEVLPLRLSVNVGQFAEPKRVGPGQYRAVYTPPPTRFPQVALVAVWRETGPDAHIDFLRFQLFGSTRIGVSSQPGAQVKVRVRGDTFGPVVADRRGRSEVPILVEPGVKECEVVIREAAGAEAVRRVPVEVPPYNRLTAALVPHAVVADGRSAVRLDVFYDLGGADVSADRIKVTPSLGTVTFEGAARGLYTYRYLPPQDTAATVVTFRVTVDGDAEARAAAQLTLGLPPPAQVVVTVPTERLRVGSGAESSIGALVVDAAGMGLPGMQLTASANGQPLPPAVYRGGGAYGLTYRAPDAFPPGGLVQLRVSATGGGRTVEGSANWQLEAAQVPGSVAMRLEPSPVPADGRTTARLVLDVRDASGQPLEHANLVTVASHGTLGKVVERGGGLYGQTYLAPEAVPDAEPRLRMMDAGGVFEKSFAIPLRPRSHPFLVGVVGGYTLAPGDASGPRLGADLWVPVRAGAARLGVGLSLGLGSASRTVSDPTGTLRSDTEAALVPLAAKVGYELWAGRRLSVTLGAGAQGSWASFKSSLAAGTQQGFGLGWMGFADLAWLVGPGQAVLGLAYGTAVVETDDFRIDAGGLSVLAGYRVGLF